MRRSRSLLILLLLLTGVFSLATVIQPRALKWTGRTQSESALKILLGDSKKLFAKQFFTEADISFHSGYYPSIFDEARQAEEQEQAVAHPEAHEAHEEKSDFLGKPKDWIDRFGRHFRPTVHTHLHGQEIGEVLPWLRVAADLNPHQIETYLVTAYWLERMNKVDEAVTFIREGLRHNPKNPALLYELGWLNFKDRQDFAQARNLWVAALRCWHQVEEPKKEPDKHLLQQILGGLAEIELREANPEQAVDYFRQLKAVSPNPGEIQKRIDTLEQQMKHRSEK